MSIFSSYKKIFLLGFIVVILIAIPFSVYIAQQRQQTTSKASQSTILSFDPASPTTKVGDILTLNIVLNPGTGASANQVSFVKLSISFDPEKFTTAGASLVPNPDSSNTLTPLEDPIFESGKATISLSVGADPTRVVTTKTKIAILKLKSLSATEADNPSSITFDSAPDTQVLSIASSDQTSENVLSTTIPATVTINTVPSALGTDPTSTPTPPPLPASSPQSTPLSQGGAIGGTGTINLTTGSAVFNPAPASETQPAPIALLPQEPLPPTGPGEKILGIGIIGAILTLIGGVLFILL